jgi:nucleotide-binding universal stress UspA family protein
MTSLNASRILVPFDFSTTSKKAIKHAVSLAKLNSGELYLFYAKPGSLLTNILPSVSWLKHVVRASEPHEKQLKEIAREIQQRYRVQTKVLIGEGNHVKEIIKSAERKHTGLIVMGTQGENSRSSLFYGSNSHRVVSKSAIPVLTVRAEATEDGYTNVLVPIDLSDYTRQKMLIAIQVAKQFSARIHLLGLLERNTDKEGLLKLILKQIESRLKEDKIAFDSEILKTSQPVKKTIAAAKRKKADLIITMADEHSEGSELGSKKYDQQLIDTSEIPVLSIPPEGHDSNIQLAVIGGMY